MSRYSSIRFVSAARAVATPGGSNTIVTTHQVKRVPFACINGRKHSAERVTTAELPTLQCDFKTFQPPMCKIVYTEQPKLVSTGAATRQSRANPSTVLLNHEGPRPFARAQFCRSKRQTITAKPVTQTDAFAVWQRTDPVLTNLIPFRPCDIMVIWSRKIDQRQFFPTIGYHCDLTNPVQTDPAPLSHTYGILIIFLASRFGSVTAFRVSPKSAQRTTRG